MAITAANIAYRVWQDLGKIDAFEEFVATGGSTTTVVNGKVADRQDRPEDNYSTDFTAIIVRDAGGANAAPEGEMQRISSYVSSTSTHSVARAPSSPFQYHPIVRLISVQRKIASSNTRTVDGRLRQFHC